MPDALLQLPGIDTPSTPPAPASDGAAPSAAPADPNPLDDEASRSASDDGSGTPPEPTGDPAPQPQPASKGVQKRIEELLTRERIANERGDRLEGLVTRVIEGIITPQAARAQAGAAASGEEDPRPMENQFTSWPEFNAAVVRWETRQEVREQFRKATEAQTQRDTKASEDRQRAAVADAEHQLHSFVGAEMRAAAERIPGFREQMENATFDLPTNVEAAIALSGSVGEVSLYLSHHPQLVPQLARLPDMAIAFHVSRIAQAMKSGSATMSNAPPPGKVGGSRGAASPLDYPKDATPQQHLDWEKRTGKAKAAAART